MRELERDLPANRAARPGGVEALPALAIVGAGRVGTAIARAAEAAGLPAALAGRAEAAEASRGAQAALLCVPDAAIAEACEQVVEAAPGLRYVGHTSGATGLDALAAARERGAGAFSLHPLQTVPDRDADLAGAPCAVAGSTPGALDLAGRLAVALGMRPFSVPDELRAGYHAAAAIASNFLVVLEESAAGLLEAVGVDEGRELLTPLVLRTAANWAERGPRALTGPIARGDTATVERHLAALRDLAPELVPLYEALAARTAAVATAAREEAAA